MPATRWCSARRRSRRPASGSLVDALGAASDGVILTSSRLPDGAIRTLAKATPLVVLNRHVDQVPSVVSDNVRAVKRAVEHLASGGHRSLTYLAGPRPRGPTGCAGGDCWRRVTSSASRCSGSVPCRPTMNGGRQAAESWRQAPTTGVVAYNDLVAIGFLQAVSEAGYAVPRDVSVVGFDNIREGELVSPQLTTIAAPLVSLGSAAVNHLLKSAQAPRRSGQTVILPARLVVRGSTGPAPTTELSASSARRQPEADKSGAMGQDRVMAESYGTEPGDPRPGAAGRRGGRAADARRR